MPRKSTIPDPVHLPGFSLRDLEVLTGAKRTHLIHWTTIGLVKASIEDTTGRGYPRRFSSYNVLETALAVAMSTRFRIQTEIIRGTLASFSWFHRGAVALWDDSEHPDHLVQRPHQPGLFKDLASRRSQAESFVRSQPVRLRTPGGEMVRVAKVAAMEQARAWFEIRSGPMAYGDPEPQFTDFLGLWINESAAVVALNPREIGNLVEEVAIVIDLAAIVFRVGQKSKQFGLNRIDLW